MGLFDGLFGGGGSDVQMPDPSEYIPLIQAQADANQLNQTTPFGSIKYTKDGPQPLSFEEWQTQNPMAAPAPSRSPRRFRGGDEGISLNNRTRPTHPIKDGRLAYDQYVTGFDGGKTSVGFEFSPELQSLFDKQFSPDAYSGYEQDYMDRYQTLLDPYRQQETDRFQQNMFNRGLPEGSDVYGDAWRPIGDQRERGDIMAAQAATSTADQRMLTDYNKLMSAMGGTAINYPMTDVMGPANMALNAAMQNAQTQNQGSSNIWNTLGMLGGGMAMGGTGIFAQGNIMTVDYTQAQDRSKILRAMMGQNFQPVQGANMGTALGKILTSYFLSKGMDKQGNLMQEAVKNEDNRKRMDLGRMMSAYREDTPYQPGPDELMPGEQPIPGLKMEGQGRNRDALLMAMASNPDYAGAALPAMLAQPKDETTNKIKTFKQAQAQGYTGTIDDFMKLSQNTTTINMAGELNKGYQFKDPNNPRLGAEIIPGSSQDPEVIAAKKTAEKQASAAADTAVKSFEQVDKIRANLINLEDALNALESGAMVGPVSQLFPDVRGSTIRLKNIQKRLGLDVIGAVTFGALSKGELDLALETALPTSLEEPELKQWIRGKMAAQEKLAGYFEEQAIYLSEPGNTQAGWLKNVKAERANPITAIVKDANGNDMTIYKIGDDWFDNPEGQ